MSQDIWFLLASVNCEYLNSSQITVLLTVGLRSKNNSAERANYSTELLINEKSCLRFSGFSSSKHQ